MPKLKEGQEKRDRILPVRVTQAEKDALTKAAEKADNTPLLRFCYNVLMRELQPKAEPAPPVPPQPVKSFPAYEGGKDATPQLEIESGYPDGGVNDE